MKRSLLAIVIALSSFSIFGCAHVHKVEGPSAASASRNEVRVQIGSNEVKSGDKVRVFIYKCGKKKVSRGEPIQTCSSQTLGEALVLSVIDDKSAIVRLDEGIVHSKNMFVEKE